MTRKDLAIKIAGEVSLHRDVVWEIINKTFAHIIDELIENEVVEFRNFGVFKVVTRKAKKARNPKRPTEEVIVPKHSVVKFKISKVLKDRLIEMDAAGTKK